MTTYHYYDAYGRRTGSGEDRRPNATDVPYPKNAAGAGRVWAFVDALGQWVAIETPPADPAAETPRPTLAVTAVAADAEHAAATSISESLRDITCPAGTVLTFAAELRDAEANVLPLDDSFRMPVVARDGRERVVIARMAAGLVTIVVPLRESGVWSVDEATINAALPPAAQMRFAGITVFAFDAA